MAETTSPARNSRPSLRREVHDPRRGLSVTSGRSRDGLARAELGYTENAGLVQLTVSMALFCLVLSRAVPILFGASMCMVAARFLHDFLFPRRPLFARMVFAAVLVAGVLLSVPFLMGSWHLLLAEYAFENHRWDQAQRRYGEFATLRGSPSPRATRQWAYSLMNLRRWQDAETVMLSSISRSAGGTSRVAPEIVLVLGICRYYRGKLDSAESTLGMLADSRTRSMREYFLGRIAETRGLASALPLYESSLRHNPNFFPSAYQAARLQILLHGRVRDAGQLAPFVNRNGASSEAAQNLVNAIELGRPLPPMEFYVVHED